MNAIAPFLSAIMPELLNIVGVVAGVLLSAVLVETKRRFGIDIRVGQANEAAHLRGILDQALWNGARSILLTAAGTPRDGLKPSDVDKLLSYLEAGIPDTLQKLGANRNVLRERARAVLNDTLQHYKQGG